MNLPRIASVVTALALCVPATMPSVAFAGTAQTATEPRPADDDPNGWGPDPQPAPASTPTPATSTPRTAQPPPPRVEPAQGQPRDDAPRRRSDGTGTLISGAVLMGIGVIGLLFVAAPAAIVKRTAMNRAAREPLVSLSSRETRLDRARRADDAMEAGFWIGAPSLVLGIPLLITGAVLRGRARADTASRVDANATGVRIRF